mgnify:FL=1
MKNVCLIVSNDQDVIDKVQTGLPNHTNHILRVFTTAQACRQFLDEDEWRLSRVRIVVDTLIDIELDEDRASVTLDEFSPSTQLMEYIHFTCPEWRILALTRPLCTNDARLALHHEPYWYCHSTAFLGWESPSLMENAFELVEKIRELAASAA